MLPCVWLSRGIDAGMHLTSMCAWLFYEVRFVVWSLSAYMVYYAMRRYNGGLYPDAIDRIQ